MDDPGCRQGVTLSERGELVPKEPTPASPPRQPFLPNPHDLIGVPAYSSKVALSRLAFVDDINARMAQLKQQWERSGHTDVHALRGALIYPETQYRRGLFWQLKVQEDRARR